MISKNLILGKLTPYTNKQSVVTYNQDATDIINGILETHEKYKSEYDKIYQYFVGYDLEDTANNIWEFLKNNVPYYIEPEDTQFLKSPASIICTEGDCKSYALFANGVLDAIRRNTGEDFKLAYRFASYDPLDQTPQHVFSVIDPGTKYEIWIDPVLDAFDQRKQPYYIKDKKIQNMALVALSGIGDMSTDTSTSSTGGWLDSILNAAPSIIRAFPQSQPQYSPYGNYGGYPTQYAQPQPAKTGISTNTLLMIGVVGLGVYFLTKK